MPRGFFAGDGQRMVDRSGAGAARAGGTKADGAGGDEDGDCGDGSGFGGGGESVLRHWRAHCGRAEAGRDSQGRDMTIDEIYDRIESAPLGPVWISLVPREVSLERASAAAG